MDYSKLNEALKNLNGFRYKNKKNIITEEIIDDNDEGGWESYEVYPLEEGLFIKMKIVSNSYGTEMFVEGVEFVRATEKTINIYAAI